MTAEYNMLATKCSELTPAGARVLDVGTEDGRTFIPVRWFDGRTIESWIGNAPHGVTLPDNYSFQQRWFECFAAANLKSRPSILECLCILDLSVTSLGNGYTLLRRCARINSSLKGNAQNSE